MENASLEKTDVYTLKKVFSAIYENDPCSVNLIANKCGIKPDRAREYIAWLTEKKIVIRYKGYDLPPKTKSQKFYSVSSKIFTAVVTHGDSDTDVQLYSYKTKDMHPIEFRVPDRSLHAGDTYKKLCLSDMRSFFKNCFPTYIVTGVVFITDDNTENPPLECTHVIDALICDEIPYRYTSKKDVIISKCLKQFSENDLLFADMTESFCTVYCSGKETASGRFKIKRLFSNGKINNKFFSEFIDRLKSIYQFEYAYIRVPFIYEKQLRILVEELREKNCKLYVLPKFALDELSLAAVSAFSPFSV